MNSKSYPVMAEPPSEVGISQVNVISSPAVFHTVLAFKGTEGQPLIIAMPEHAFTVVATAVTLVLSPIAL